MTTDERHEITAPNGFLFGEGVVFITPALESEEPYRCQLIFRENWDGPREPVGVQIPSDHPRAFWDKEKPIFAPEDCTTLHFANAEGLVNLIHELVNLHGLRFPRQSIPGVSAEVVEQIMRDKYNADAHEVFARLGEVRHDR